MKRRTLEEMLQQTPFIVTELMDLVSGEEIQQIAIEEFETAKQYIKLDHDSTRSECTCSSELKILQDKLDSSEITIQTLSQKLNENLPPFCEDSFTSDEFTMFYTGLPNINIVKSIFEHVSKGLEANADKKLTLFQEFICVLMKLRTNTANEDLSYCFNVSCTTVSRLLLKWLKQMDVQLWDLIVWPEREIL